jgi:hypothetical protein
MVERRAKASYLGTNLRGARYPLAERVRGIQNCNRDSDC